MEIVNGEQVSFVSSARGLVSVCCIEEPQANRNAPFRNPGANHTSYYQLGASYLSDPSVPSLIPWSSSLCKSTCASVDPFSSVPMSGHTRPASHWTFQQEFHRCGPRRLLLIVCDSAVCGRSFTPQKRPNQDRQCSLTDL
jgi:hypothetical protein